MSKAPSSVRFGVIGLLILAFVIVAVVTAKDDSKPKAAKAPASACGQYRKDGSVMINGQTFETEIAKNSAEFEKGLGGRPCILDNQAMLFGFTKPGQYKFWMKDMNFPIDILWINSVHRVAAIEIDVQPSTYHSQNPYFINDPQHPAQYVLEINANQSKKLNIKLGTSVSF